MAISKSILNFRITDTERETIGKALPALHTIHWRARRMTVSSFVLAAALALADVLATSAETSPQYRLLVEKIRKLGQGSFGGGGGYVDTRTLPLRFTPSAPIVPSTPAAAASARAEAARGVRLGLSPKPKRSVKRASSAKAGKAKSPAGKANKAAARNVKRASSAPKRKAKAPESTARKASKPRSSARKASKKPGRK